MKTVLCTLESKYIHVFVRQTQDGFGGLVLSMLASVFKPGPKPLDFSGVKIFSMPSS